MPKYILKGPVVNDEEASRQADATLKWALGH
jgi:hypothetical protein